MRYLFRLFLLLICGGAVQAFAQPVELPERCSPQRETTNGVPHVQVGVSTIPKYSEELIRRIGLLDGVGVENTANSLAGARGFRLNPKIKPARPQSLLSGNEFAHLHADGSLHAFLNPKLAKQAVTAKWAIYHPWAGRSPGWNGYVMIYTPTTSDELDAVANLVEQSYQFVTGNESENQVGGGVKLTQKPKNIVEVNNNDNGN